MLHGKGVQKDYFLARELFNIAAHKFGHFDSIHNLGILSYEGQEGDRSAKDALKYLKLSSSMGSYHNWIRRGLDNYLNGLYLKSFMCYLRASNLGYEIASANAAYIIQRKVISNSLTISSIMFSYIFGQPLSQFGSNPQYFIKILKKIQTDLYAQSARMGNVDSMVNMGHAYMEGTGIEAHPSEAISWYSRASAKGQPLGSFYIAMMNHFGMKIPQNIARAVHFYELTLRDERLPATFRLIVSSLLYLARWRVTSTLVKTFAGTFEQFVNFYVGK